MDTIKGFNNIGNTCYLNSGLQLLIQNDDFCDIIIENKDKSPNLKIMAEFIKQYYGKDSSVLTPLIIKKMVGQKNKIFSGSSQQDAGEFILYLLDILDTDLKSNMNKLFDITTETTIKCRFRECLNTSKTINKNPFLILPIKESCGTLDECYREFKMYEKLEKDDMYYCERCKEKRIASRRLNVTEWSNNLIIWLKRFENNGKRLTKNNQDIEIPIDWRHDFTIKGAVIHGGSINSGHYVYISRNLKNDTWLMCDDSSIRTIPNDRVLSLLRKAYILSYVKNI